MSVGSAKSGSSSYYGCCDCESLPETMTVDLCKGWSDGPNCPDPGCCEDVEGEHSIPTEEDCDYNYTPNPGVSYTWRRLWDGQPSQQLLPCNYACEIDIRCRDATGPTQYDVWVLVYSADPLSTQTIVYHLELGTLDCEGDDITVPFDHESGIDYERFCVNYPSSVNISW